MEDVLIAPRPVRLSNLVTRTRFFSGPDHLERARVSDENADVAEPLDLSGSQRSSPRSPLPSEAALEEFLSILRPTFFPERSSPVLFTRRAGVTLPTFTHERSYSLKGRSVLLKNDIVEEVEVSRSTQPSRNTKTPSDTLEELENNILPIRWFASTVLSSPISRTHTKNPFNRHILASPSPVSPITLSPAAVPLPLPTPDELMLLEIS
uniref:Uncharacterized protein n=1 Tax=Mycena chlorophos TaxID=658473 RepID=A0ABQ0MBV0_MYCCL|nr:predicted protein [Mycena chlorophos]